MFTTQRICKNLQLSEKNHFNLLRPFIKKGLKIEELKNFFNSKLKKNVKKNQLVEKNHFTK